MKAFSLIDPSGKEIVKLKSKDLERIGLEQFLLESAKPSVDLLKSGFPEGVYQFRAKTFGGEHLYGERYLSHYIAPVVELSPCGEVGLPVNNVILQWALVNETASYEIEIEQDELEVNISAALDGSTTQFTVFCLVVPAMKSKSASRRLQMTATKRYQSVCFLLRGNFK